ncbi:MAG TPA: ribonuclease R [Nevskiaceae bacterium]|nr:ribonuclease R [Nevskiaceae bacterium]
MKKKPPAAGTGDWRKQDPDHAREQERHEQPIPSRRYIRTVLRDEGAPLTLEELCAHFGLEEGEHEALKSRLQAMVREGEIAQNRRGAYGEVKQMNLVSGVIQAHRDGFGFLIPDEGGPDVFLPPRQMRELMNGDRALVRITGVDERGRREGALADVLERGSRTVVGRLHAEQGVTYVIPDNPRVQQDLLIPPESRASARHGQMVVAEIVTPPGKRTLPVGRVTEILGEHLAPGMEIEAAIRAHGLPHVFPDAVEREAAEIPDEVRAEDRAGREDLRGLPLMTIDGVDARDFDDAVFAQRAKDGWKLWVAIADVSAYVKPGAPLDEEGLKRGNSVYFPQRVIPMLPEKLSNGLCSLNPDVDRLCMVCEMRVTPKGEIAQSRFFESVMRSRARLIYEDVARILENPDGAEAHERPHIVEPLQVLNEVFEALFAAREARGAIDFDSTETKVLYDAQRKIERIVPVQRNRAHRLIEECMIAANIEAGKLVARRKVPAPYRIHEQPDTMKVMALREFLAGRGLKLGGGDKPTAMDYAKTLERAKQRPDASVIQTVMLRSLMQARYSATNVGHFGLALTHYAHFTSPIRRYPDLLLHRAIKHVLAGRRDEFEYTVEDMERHGAHCSMTERRADEATRDAMLWLKCEYMREHVGDEFDGVVSSVAPFGLFVELQGLYVDGLVHVTALANDYYQFDKSHQRLVGERSKRAFGLGDRMRVRVVRVNLDERKIDLEPVGGASAPRPAKGKRR